MARQPSRAKPPSQHKNYPRRGTPSGEVIIGSCDGAGCDRELHRGDPFFITLANTVFCSYCWQEQPGVSRPGPLAVPASAPKEPERTGTVWNGDWDD